MSCCGGRCKPDENFDPCHEGPSDSDVARFGGETRPCPECRADVYDESEWCPKCGHAFSAEEMASATPGVKPWVVVTGVVVVAAFVLTMIVF
jgi:hypothetical protein